MKRIGIDVGGTFTDVVLLDVASSTAYAVKVPTTPANPVEGAFNGVTRILDLTKADRSDVDFIGHGTTIATNMIIEGKGARTALVTTKGFRDILEIRRVSRHDRADLYDLFFKNPPPLIPRHLRFEVDERLTYRGQVQKPLDPALIQDMVRILTANGIEAVAISFIHSYANPQHEKAMIEGLRRHAPALFVSASCDVNPEAFEYERTSTTAINALLGPVCGRYIENFERKIHTVTAKADVMFMQSNGGLAKPDIVARRPVALLESGPAGGVSAAAKLCRRLGIANAITGDMGGTSFDVSIIRGGNPELKMHKQMASHAVRVPTIDIESIGAGGGSIIWIDAGGGLHVGPQSAGGNPGPACYGRGGAEPTITDCNLVLGYVNAESFKSGDLKLDVDAAHRIIEHKLAKPLGIGVVEAAQMSRTVANAMMAQAMRLMTVERGFDPREFNYICFGGAGPVHAVELAAELGMRRIVVPSLPGVFSALGMLVSDQTYDFQAAVSANLDLMPPADLAQRVAALERQAREFLAQSVADSQGLTIRRRADCRYVGQAENLTIDFADHATPDDIRSSFEAEHKRQWNFLNPGSAVVLVNLRIQVIVASANRYLPTSPAGTDAMPKPYRQRKVAIGGAATGIPAFLRAELKTGDRIAGPAAIEEASSDMVIPHGWAAQVDAEQNLIVEAV